MQIIVGIDVGGSTTKIVGFDGERLLPPQMVRATDPIASVYGAFGKFTSEHRIALSDIARVHVTGVGAAFLEDSIYGLETVRIHEFAANARGGLYLSGLSRAIIVSMGTGTAYVCADGKDGEYLGGTGVGGGTLIGLSKKLLGVSDPSQLAELAKNGDLSKIDLRINDISRSAINSILSDNATAANFGKVSDLATREDIALGIFNMVYETIGMMAVFAARQKQCDDVVLIGNLAGLPHAHVTFSSLEKMFGLRFLIPENATFGTVIGAALSEKQSSAPHTERNRTSWQKTANGAKKSLQSCSTGQKESVPGGSSPRNAT